MRRGLALQDLAARAALPLERVSHRHVPARCWELRDDLTGYDAAYVAPAELLDGALLTADARIGRAPGVRCGVETLSA